MRWPQIMISLVDFIKCPPSAVGKIGTYGFESYHHSDCPPMIGNHDATCCWPGGEYQCYKSLEQPPRPRLRPYIFPFVLSKKSHILTHITSQMSSSKSKQKYDWLQIGKIHYYSYSTFSTILIELLCCIVVLSSISHLQPYNSNVMNTYSFFITKF